VGRGATIVFWALILMVSTVRVAIINRPFIANSESLACGWASSSVRNYVRFGPAASRFAGVLNSGETAPESWIIYSHHPPLTLLLGAIPILLAGESEWTSRFVPAVFSVATTALLFFIARRRFGLRVAAVAGLIYAFCPMTLALGDMTEYLNAPLVFCGVATIGAYGRWLETKRRSWAYAAILFFVLGTLSDWPIFYLVPLLAAHAVLTHAARVPRVLIIALAASLLFAALAGWMLWSGGDVSLAAQFALRASTDGIDLRDWIARVVVYHQGMLHTWPVLVLSGIWLAHLARQRLMGRLPDLSAQTIPLLLVAWGAIHVVVGAQGTYWHAWWSMILTPAFALRLPRYRGGDRRLAAPDPARRIAWPLATASPSSRCRSSAQTAYRFTLDEWGSRRLHPQNIGTAIRPSASTEGIAHHCGDRSPGALVLRGSAAPPAITSVSALQPRSSWTVCCVLPVHATVGPPPTWFVMPVSDQATTERRRWTPTIHAAQ
jgi:hypothetical protein